MKDASALYVGRVAHQRLRPLRHRLSYRVFWLLLDLDELPTLSRRLRFFSLNRFNLLALHERDHGADDGRSLRAQLDEQLLAAGLQAGGPIHLLTMPRILGFVFNPLSVFFSHRPDGVLQAILYEVNNTFGERHSYLVAVPPDEARAGLIRQDCAKALHVSPFLPVQHTRYTFRVRPPQAQQEALRLSITVRDAQGPVLHASLEARRRPLVDAALVRVFLAIPLMTVKVVAAILWEALRLWCKGVPLHAHPPAPGQPVSLVQLEKRT